MAGLIGKKLGMTRFFMEDGKSIPATLIEVETCIVTQIKTDETDGYNAIQIAYDIVKEDKSKKPQLAIYKKLGIEPRKHMAEFEGPITFMDGEEKKAVEVGAELNVDQFQEGELVKISSKSKGKGFAGVVKRYNFAGGPKTHGQTDMHRSRGSIGASSWPSRVFKGMRMAGRMGGDKITLKKIRILKIDLEKNLLVVKGPVPGAINATVRIWN